MDSCRFCQFFNSSGYTKFAVLIIAGLTLFRLWFCTQTDLAGDEAYYWLWSQNLDWSYFSKGPLVAWTIFLGTKLFGDTVLGVRFFSVLLSGGTAYLIFLLGKKLFSERIGFWSVIVAMFVPLFMLGGFIMTIDPLSVFFWTLAIWLFWKHKDSQTPIDWIPAGLAVGIGMLAKYTNAAELVCFGLFCLWIPVYRKKWPHFLTMTAAALFCMIPVIIWNQQNDWVTLEHLIHRGSLDKPWRFSSREFLQFVQSQFIVFNPLFLLGLLFVLLRMKRAHLRQDTFRFLLSLFLPLPAFYLILSLNESGQANWTAPAWISAIILLPALWLETPRKWMKAAAQVALGLSLVAFVLFHLLPFIYLPQYVPGLKVDPIRRIKGHQNIVEQVASIQNQTGADFLIGDTYANSALLSFYHPQKQRAYVPLHEGKQNQFSFWPDYGNRAGQSALYVSERPEIPQGLREEFENVRLILATQSMFRGHPMRDYHIYDCQNLKK